MSWFGRPNARVLATWLLTPVILTRVIGPIGPATVPLPHPERALVAEGPLGGSMPTAGGASGNPLTSGTVRVRPRAPADGYLVAWARGRWHAAGLHLPPVDVVFHDDREGCHEHIGVYVHGSGPAIHLCLGGKPLSVAGRKTVLHELGHAWAAAYLDEAERVALSRRWDRPGWNGPDLSWEESASEVAAEVIAWGLMDRHLRMPTLPGWDADKLEREFTLLTGRRPLVPGIE